MAPLDLPPQAARDLAPPSLAALVAGALPGPLLFWAVVLWHGRAARLSPLATASPAQLAEALRQALAGQPGPQAAAARRALTQLDRLLYSDQSAPAKALEAAAREARRVLAERAR
jgi:hypothetical protein